MSSPPDSAEVRWLARLRERRREGALHVAALEDVEALIAERDEARAEIERLRAERDQAQAQIAALRGVFGECLHPEPVMSGRGVHKRRVGSRACGECKACVSFGALEKGVK